MIAVDTSSLVAFFGGGAGDDVEILFRAMQDKQVILPPVVLTEVMSQPGLPKDFLANLLQLPLIEITPGYWNRAGLLRSAVLARGRKARIADALIAQSCLDQKCALVTRDRDFRHFEKHAGLKLFLK